MSAPEAPLHQKSVRAAKLQGQINCGEKSIR